MATIKDVAKLAGVSPITASRALNNPSMVSSKTIEKVKAATIDLGYQPSRVAQGLRTGQTRIFTLVVQKKDAYDPLLFEFASGVSEACRAKGYSLLIYPSNGTEDLRDLVGKVDGLILTDIKDCDFRIVHLQSELPIAIFGQSLHNVPQIDVDNFWGAKIATDYLQSRGFREIEFITSNSDWLFLKHREQGYLASRIDARFSPYITYNTFDVRGGYHAIQEVVKSRKPEAIFCASDAMAIGAIRFLRQQNINLPIVGYDGGYLTELTDPTLTSIKQPFFTVGERLVEALFQFIEKGHVTRELVKPELIIKESA